MLNCLPYPTYFFLLCNNYRPHPKNGGMYCFHFVCQSTSRGGTPVRSGGGTPSQVWWGSTPSQVQVGGVPNPRSRQEEGVPHPRSGWGTPSFPPPDQVRMGYPPGTWNRVSPWTWDGVPPRPGMGYPPPANMGHSEHLLCGRWYASCVHAGGLSCFFFVSDFNQ